MRLDVTLYIVALISFIFTPISFILLNGTEGTLCMAIAAILGIICVGLAYYTGQKTKTIIIKGPTTSTIPTPTKTNTQPISTQDDNKEVAEVVEEEVAEEIIEQTMPPVQDVPVEDIQPTETAVPITETSANQTPTVPTQAETNDLSLANVKGVGEKRVIQLNAIGIHTAKDLAQASVEDIAKGLKISPKIATKLIEAAKQ
jgi:predicted flap endonuclease-1-like 5' DNA nuclease